MTEKKAGFFDRIIDSFIESAPDLLKSGGQQILTQQTEADKLKVQREELEVQREELAEEIRKNKENTALQRQKMQIELALAALNAQIAAAEDREFEALQRMEQQKMSRGTAQDVTSALANLVSQTQAGIK